MKWKDLSLKERKQIYDSVRVNNPGATYFDIKQQFDSIPEYEDGKDESVAASFSLPEVNIYPQNRFGDIARTQGYETAKNWKKVKEGTTAGINTFINSPHAQFVQTMLPLPDGLEHLGSGIKQVKQFIKSESDRYARNVYNNLMPMSYYSSYTGKNKLNEIKGAVKDYIKGKDPKDLNNPKWKEEAYKIFEDDYKRNPNRDSSFEMEPNMALEARMEAFQNYLKLPHEPKYFVEIDKNKRLFDINLDNVPKRNINNWLNNAAELNNNSSRVIIDKLVNTGGNVKMSKTPSSKKASVYLPEFDAYTEYKDAVNVNYEDVWDIQPLSSPGRSPLSRIEIMGTKPFVKEIPNPNNPFGTDIEYRKFLLPDLWKDIEAGKILRGKPFTVKNTIEALEGIDLDGPYITPLSDTNVKSIPKYQDGKGKAINKADLPPEYRTGTPEYFERQRKISGAVNTVQPEAYITPAGYIKDAVNFIEDLGKGDYAGAAMDAVLNLIPWGVGKGIKKLKSKVGRMVEGTEIDGASVHSFAPTQTKKKTKKKTEEDYDSEFSEVLRKDRNSKKYQQEISRTIEQAIFPDERTRELVENVDKTYGTNYKRAYSNIAYKDTTKRGSYVKWGNTDKDGYGQINIKNIKDNVLPTDINDYNIILDNNIYMPGTANHELGHVADGLAGSRKIQDFDSGKEYITNTYLNYLANSNNTYSSAELRKMGLFDAAGSRSYLLNPTEAKSRMLTLKRSLKDSGKITNWSTPVDENMILEYMRNPTSNKMVKNQYDLYRNKNEYIDRLNKLIPMEILMPLGGAGFVGHELNKE